MVKGLFAGLAGLGAAVAVVQLQSDGGAGPAGADAAAMMDASVAAVDAASGAGPAATADAGVSGPERSSTADAPLRFPPARPDAGPVYLGDAPGRVRVEADAGAPDAGRAERAADADAGSPDDELRRLRERVARLEQELARSRSDAQTQELDRLNRQVASLREQLAQEQARRQQEELAAQQSKAREQEATAVLADVQRQLATGDYGALDALESVSGSLPPPVQGAVQSARTAIQNRDLAAARYWLSVALAEEQRRLLTH
jgi:signal transduction histidine kinase